MTNENVTESKAVEPTEAVPAKAPDDQLIDELVGRGERRHAAAVTGAGLDDFETRPLRHPLPPPRQRGPPRRQRGRLQRTATATHRGRPTSNAQLVCFISGSRSFMIHSWGVEI
jgi:hypothetical protein